ncbi:DNA phosphorothioation-associated protein 4 [Spirulina sp. CS-785/01]|uniref:DNA phosphorothioation-associated protein 4 n=1 Tax=Spirulina sp. CS-785/01 TaxID=3021716 RepID=UPI00233109A4|nr:DNA phosphorothioation-associated protein 4 [Spirulina sp. CS-785/01]MDB9313541.1 DNA phosphorothioation-associated protein 4 [Spirulina sp. CS-785/01]
MGASRVRVAKDKAELVQALVAAADTTGPFQTYADAVAFAALMGVQWQKRVPIGTAAKNEPSPIALEIFISRGYDRLLKLLALVETQTPQVLSSYNPENEGQWVRFFEEYANGGLELLQEELRGAVDYTERLLLLLTKERYQEESSPEDFDLSRFL